MIMNAIIRFNTTYTAVALAAIITLSIFSPVHGQTETQYFNSQRLELIEAYIQQGMAEEAIPGVAVALIENGQVVYTKGFGKSDASGALVTPQTPFQLASITKSFSALLMLQLENEGKLALSDRVVDHIPWFTTSNTALSDQITLRHLLQHNSGFTTASGNLTQNTDYRGADATALSVQKLSTAKLHSKPGTVYQYSNSNYHIVSHLIEKLEGKPFEQVMAERILRPLDMKNSFVQIAEHETHTPAIGFPHWFGIPVEREFVLGRMKMGDGGLVASVEDLADYIIEVAHGGSGLVSKEMRNNLLNTEHNNAAYGLGWEVYSNQGENYYEHGGGNGGFTNLMGFSDASNERGDIGFAILSNYSSALHNQFVWNLRRVIFNQSPKRKTLNTVNLVSLVTLYFSAAVLVFFLLRTIRQNRVTLVNARALITPALLLLYSYAMTYLVPAMNKINLLSIYPFFPDLAVGLIACAALSFILACVKLLKLTALFSIKGAST